MAFEPLRDLARNTTGIRHVARFLAHMEHRADVTGALRRIAEHDDGGTDHLSPMSTSGFCVAPDILKAAAGRCIVLLDDYTATGSSLRTCRELLLRAGAQRVRMLALARF